jgi:TetR/AcrR family transcriptional regulator, tetracycline repressor protein
MATKKSKEKIQNNASRETLDIDKIVKAAMKLLNEEGLQQLTTRRLAESLGKRSASLYWHVRDKAELLQLLAENILWQTSPA